MHGEAHVHGATCAHGHGHGQSTRRERALWLAVALSAVVMVAEIAVGHSTGSLALLADGWHMATHVGALGLSALASRVALRYAGHRAFAFGTGKLASLAGYTSALGLAAVAVGMCIEAAERALAPSTIDFADALPVAAVGLVVNLACAGLLHDHEAEHDHHHRAAYLHVLADAVTSVLALGALGAGEWLAIAWLDPVSGALGGVLILHWSVGLLRRAGAELLDMVPSERLAVSARAALEAVGGARVSDLRVWSLGGGRHSCVVTLLAPSPRHPAEYRAALAALAFSHVTIEVQPLGAGSADHARQRS
jgi:cation diffusion facilitator family transporter